MLKVELSAITVNSLEEFHCIHLKDNDKSQKLFLFTEMAEKTDTYTVTCYNLFCHEIFQKVAQIFKLHNFLKHFNVVY